MSVGDIGLLYINTNLLYDVYRLVEFLKHIACRGLIDRIRFTTSYDTYGRFSSETQRCLFMENLNTIHNEIPELRIVVNSIMTKDLCDRLKSGNGYRETVNIPDGILYNLIPYIGDSDEFRPDRNDVFKTLLAEDRMNNGFLRDYVANFDLQQRKIVLKYDPTRDNFIDSSSDYSACGHGINFSKYSNSGSCFICDMKELVNIYG